MLANSTLYSSSIKLIGTNAVIGAGTLPKDPVNAHISVLATTIPTAKFPPLSVFPVTTGPPESPGLLHTDKDERFLICLPL